MAYRYHWMCAIVLAVVAWSSPARASHCQDCNLGFPSDVWLVTPQIGTDGVAVLVLVDNGLGQGDPQWNITTVTVTDGDGNEVRGALEVVAGFRPAAWRPDDGWAPGTYQITVDVDTTAFESVSGGPNGCEPYTVELELQVTDGPAHVSGERTLSTTETYFMNPAPRLNSLVCCDEALPFNGSVAGILCPDSPSWTLEGDYSCAATTGSAYLSVATELQIDGAAASPEYTLRELTQGNYGNGGGSSFVMRVHGPGCHEFEALDHVTGEISVHEVCFEESEDEPLGSVELDPTEELAAICSGPTFVCEVLGTGAGARWNAEACTTWPQGQPFTHPSEVDDVEGEAPAEAPERGADAGCQVGAGAPSPRSSWLAFVVFVLGGRLGRRRRRAARDRPPRARRDTRGLRRYGSIVAMAWALGCGGAGMEPEPTDTDTDATGSTTRGAQTTDATVGTSSGGPAATSSTGADESTGTDATGDPDALPLGIYALAGSDPDLDTADLAAFDELIGDATWVGLGESIHRSGGYYTMKHRLFRYLVHTHGFRVFAWETPWFLGRTATDYVESCRGGASDAMDGLFRVWRSESVRDLLQWMCTYNAEHPDDPLTFVGWDIQQAPFDLMLVDRLLEQFGIDAADPLRADMTSCAGWGHGTMNGFHELPEVTGLRETGEPHLACMAAFDQFDSWLDAEEDAVATALSPEAVAWARISSVSGRAHQEAIADGGDGYNTVRDEGNAYVLRATREILFPEQRVVMWAHNGHLARNWTRAYTYRSLGQIFTEEREPYVAIGLVSSAPNGTPIEADTTLEHQLAPLGPDTLLVRFDEQIDLGQAELLVGGIGPMAAAEQWDALVWMREAPAMTPVVCASCEDIAGSCYCDAEPSFPW